MENHYDVGIANRYALFLEEGENSLTAIKKKLSKETRQKNKAIKKENAEAKKIEAAKLPEEVEKPETTPVINDALTPKKEVKDEKTDVPKSKDKKSNDASINRKDKEPQEKSRNKKNGADSAAANENDSVTVAPVAQVETFEPIVEKVFSKSSNENGPPRKTFERRGRPRERRFENSDQNQSSRPYNSQYNSQYNKRNNSNYNNGSNVNGNNSQGKDDWDAKEWDDNKDSGAGAGTDNVATDRYQDNENRNTRENGYGSHPNNEYRPRGGGRFRGGSRGGGRGNYNGGADRRRDYNNDQRNEQKDDSNVFKNDSWGDEKPETTNDITDNQKDEENKATENDASGSEDQKEVKEFVTYDEWKKSQGERQKPQYNLRKAGEGEDLTQWKNMRELEKKKDEKFLESNNKSHEKSNLEQEKENAHGENVQRVGRQKHIDINVHFRESSSRSRGGRVIRNTRGGFKGRNEYRNDDNYGGESRSFRKPREGGYAVRGNRGGIGVGGPPPVRQNDAPKMDDESAFPSLG